MTETRTNRRRGFTIFPVLGLLVAAIASSGCALHARQAASVRALEEAAESTPVVPEVEPPEIE